MKRLPLLLVALLACGLIAAGCGDDDDDGDDSPATTETAPAEDSASADERVESCKRGVRTNGGQLSEELRSDLEDLCEQAGDGDSEELREASRDLCRRVVEETVPEGQAGRDQALEACDSAATP